MRAPGCLTRVLRWRVAFSHPAEGSALSLCTPILRVQALRLEDSIDIRQRWESNAGTVRWRTNMAHNLFLTHTVSSAKGQDHLSKQILSPGRHLDKGGLWAVSRCVCSSKIGNTVGRGRAYGCSATRPHKACANDCRRIGRLKRSTTMFTGGDASTLDLNLANRFNNVALFRADVDGHRLDTGTDHET